MNASTTCTVAGCDRHRQRRGMCPKHYRAAWEAGTHTEHPTQWGQRLEENRERFLELQAEGLSASAIAERLGVTARTVTRWRRDEGLSQPSSELAGRRVSPGRLAEAERMLDDGAPYQEVHRTLGMNLRTLKRHFPGRAWTKHQSGVFAAMVTHTNRQMNRKAAA